MAHATSAARHPPLPDGPNARLNRFTKRNRRRTPVTFVPLVFNIQFLTMAVVSGADPGAGIGRPGRRRAPARLERRRSIVQPTDTLLADGATGMDQYDGDVAVLEPDQDESHIVRGLD